VFAAGVSIVGVADWQMEMELDDGQPLAFRTSLRSPYEDLAFASSANSQLERWRAPILFVNGDDDHSGWLRQAIQLGQSLRQRGVEVESWVEPGGTHGGVSQRHVLERVRRVIEFFDRRLENGK
ncbi:alpha/beta hydrolase family protein, partial [Steroidobacter sp.]|uniref:alpha/beta hydrolase family protein n=1 Tax=Steroidobacter sp. TaxID=1978227 RepID=UPI001A44064E